MIPLQLPKRASGAPPPDAHMATALPRPLQPPLDPPTSALPPIPTAKGRKSLPAQLASAASRLPTNPQTPAKLRTPSRAGLPVPSSSASATPSQLQQSSSTPSVPTLKSTGSRIATPSAAATAAAAAAGGDKGVRRSVSIAAFPQPPKSAAAASRVGAPSGGRPSLGGTLITVNLDKSLPKEPGSASTPNSAAAPLGSGVTKLKRLKKTPSSMALHGAYTSNAPSLLNGSGDTVPVSAGTGSAGRGSGSQLGLPSPPRSRSSSAQGSYSTSATTFEDVDEAPGHTRGRDEAREGSERRGRSSGKETKGNVLVSVRVRPDEGGDLKSEGEWMVDGRRSLVAFKGKEGGDYFYDNVFATHDNNDKVYEACAKRLVRRVMEGYHGTVFAYGMTGTGKTFSMQGTGSSPGVIPKAITDIFSFIRETPHREFLLRASYLEIYNEEIRDLLAPLPAPGPNGVAPPPEKIKLREDGKRGVYATPLREEIVQSPMQLLRVIARGDKSRHTGTTQYNVHSSRSHAVVKIVVESRDRSEPPEASSAEANRRNAIVPGGVRVSTLSLIDLAGSERAADSKERRTEGAHINKSLLTLGTVIARLSGDKDKSGNPTDRDGKHLPYRDSKLTRLLQPALCGNSLISILCTIQIGSVGSAAAANNHTGETLNTLKFAARAKNNIVSHAKKVEEAAGTDGDAASRGLLERYRLEIQNLRTQLEGQAAVQAEKEEKQIEKDAEDRHKDQLLEMQLARTALKERIEHLNRLILSSQSTGVNAGTSYAHLSLSGTQAKLASVYASLGDAGGSGRSLRSSASASTVHRTPSGASTTTMSTHLASLRSPAVASPTARDASPDLANEDDEDVAGGDGQAPLHDQNRMLQADLAEKNRYIAKLEHRLMQARRSSNNGRASATTAAATFSLAALQDKDAEIVELRAKLDASQRAIADLRDEAAKLRSAAAEPSHSASPASTSHTHDSASLASLKDGAPHRHGGSYGSVATTNSTSLSPIDLPAATKGRSPLELLAAARPTHPIAATTNNPAPTEPPAQPLPASPRDGPPGPPELPPPTGPLPPVPHRRASRKSIDGLSKMLDEMIQEKVERGELVPDAKRGGGVGVRAARERRQESLGQVAAVEGLATREREEVGA